MGLGLVVSADLAQAQTGAMRVPEALALARGVHEADARGVRVVRAAAHAGTVRRGHLQVVGRVREKYLVRPSLSPGQDRVVGDPSPGEYRDERDLGLKGHKTPPYLSPAAGGVGRGPGSGVGPEKDQPAGAPGLGEHRAGRGLGPTEGRPGRGLSLAVGRAVRGPGRRPGRGARALGPAEGRVGRGQSPGEHPAGRGLPRAGRGVPELREQARGGPARPATAPHGRGPGRARRVTGRPRSRPASPRTSSTRRHARS